MIFFPDSRAIFQFFEDRGKYFFPNREIFFRIARIFFNCGFFLIEGKKKDCEKKYFISDRKKVVSDCEKIFVDIFYLKRFIFTMKKTCEGCQVILPLQLVVSNEKLSHAILYQGRSQPSGW